MLLPGQFGIGVEREPRMYAALYENGHARPDVVFTGAEFVATDVTVVHPGAEVGVAADEAAAQKIAQNQRAVEALGHKFIPFVMEAFGFFHVSCHELCGRLAHNLPTYAARAFSLAFLHAASSALAVARG